MEQLPKVTVITVTRNIISEGRKDFLIQNFESVHSQTYPNIEHWVADGSSTDGTIDLLEEYAQKGYIKYFSQIDNGPYDAMNKAIKKINGEYIVLLHSDDYLYDENVIEIQMNYLQMTKSDYVTGDTILLDTNGKEVVYHGIASRYDNNLKMINGNNEHTFWIEIPFNHEGIIMKKNVFEKVGYFDNQEIYGPSTDFKFEIDLILKDLRHTYVPYNFLYFRLGGVSSKEDTKFYNILKYFYSKFYFVKINDIKEYDLLRQYPNKLFVHGLKSYLTSLNLKNFNYKKCFDFLDMMLSKNEEGKFFQKNNLMLSITNKRIYTYYRLLGLPLIKIKQDKHGHKHYKLFGLISILKIKINKRNQKIYKLFSLLPIFVKQIKVKD